MGSGPKWNTNYTKAPPFTVYDIGNFSAFEIKVQAVNEKGEGPEADPVIGYSGEDGKKNKEKLFLNWEYFYLVFCFTFDLPVCCSSIGGSNECGCYFNEQHNHHSELGSCGQRDGQRTPAGIQGTAPVSPILFHIQPLSSLPMHI